MADTGLERVRKLYEGIDGTPEIQINDAEQDEAVYVVQDFLAEHGFNGIPNPQNEKGNPKKVPVYGKFGTTTKNALMKFYGLKTITGFTINTARIRKLIDEAPKSPRARLSRLVLNLKADTSQLYDPPIDPPPKGFVKILSLTSIFEGGFATLGRNKDGVGLSYGIIQWNQRDKRLAEVVGEFKRKHLNLFKQSFGNAKAEEMLAHIRDNANGGVKKFPDGHPEHKNNGKTIRPDGLFELFKPKRPGDLAWDELFIKAGHIKEFQKIQVSLAVKNFKELKNSMGGYANAIIKTQRGIAFMIDLSNQHGEAGAQDIYVTILPQVINEPENIREKKAMEAMRTESVKRIPVKFKEGAISRRTFFIETKHLNGIQQFKQDEY